MPAFAVNWGKFPAIASPAVIAILVLCFQDDYKKPKIFFWGSMFVLGVALLHTRIIICVLLAGVCFFLSNKLPLGAKPFFFNPSDIRCYILFLCGRLCSFLPIIIVDSRYW